MTARGHPDRPDTTVIVSAFGIDTEPAGGPVPYIFAPLIDCGGIAMKLKHFSDDLVAPQAEHSVVGARLWP